jgi:hypothetical protein
MVDAWRRQKDKSAPPAKKGKMENPTTPTPEPDEDSVEMAALKKVGGWNLN